MPKLLVCDDHAVIRDLLCSYLRDNIQESVVYDAHDYTDIYMKSDTYGPFDLIILDYKMPGWDGISGIRTLMDATPGTRVVLFSGLISAEELEAAQALGIAGYIPKSFEARTTLNAIRKLLAGGSYFPPMASAIAHALQAGSGAPADHDVLPRHKLTERQIEILRRLVQGQTNKQIGLALDIAEGTVKNHVKNILDALGARNRTEAAAIAARMAGL